MGFEVRCSCGQAVIADEAHRGQVIQCPTCKAGVAVPVAVGGLRQPTPEEIRGRAVAELLLGLGLAAVGVFLWQLPFGKLMVMGGLAVATDASRRF